MPIRQRGSTYQADVRYCGERIRHSFSSFASAHEWEVQAQADIQLGRRPTPPEGSKAARLTLGDALKKQVEEWRETCSAHRDLERNARHVVDILGQGRAMSTIAFADIERLVKELREHGNSGSTIKRKLAALSKLYSYARQHDPSLVKPAFPKVLQGRPRERVVTEQEHKAVLGWNGWTAQERNLLAFLWATGCRLGEALDLDPKKDTYFAEIMVDGQKVKRWNVTFRDTKAKDKLTGKGDDRTIPVTKDVFDAAQDMKTNAWMFRRRLRSVCKTLGIEPIIPHNYRHTRATLIAAKAPNAFLLQKWMGHRSIKTSEKYVHVVSADLHSLL